MPSEKRHRHRGKAEVNCKQVCIHFQIWLGLDVGGDRQTDRRHLLTVYVVSLSYKRLGRRPLVVGERTAGSHY